MSKVKIIDKNKVDDVSIEKVEDMNISNEHVAPKHVSKKNTPSKNKNNISKNSKKKIVDVSSTTKLSRAEIAEAKADRIVNVILIVLALAIIGGIVGWIVYKNSTVPPVIATPETFEQIYNKTLAGYETDYNYKYEGYIFVKDTDGLWTTKIVKNTQLNKTNSISREMAITMYFGPKEMENISSTADINSVLNKNTIYTSFESFNSPDYAIAGVEIRKIIGNQSLIIKRNAVTGIYGNNTGIYPFADCNNVTAQIGVIEFRIGNESSITGENGCVVLTGTNERDLIRVADKFVLTILGIIKI